MAVKEALSIGENLIKGITKKSGAKAGNAVQYALDGINSFKNVENAGKKAEDFLGYAREGYINGLKETGKFTDSEMSAMWRNVESDFKNLYDFQTGNYNISEKMSLVGKNRHSNIKRGIREKQNLSAEAQDYVDSMEIEDKQPIGKREKTYSEREKESSRIEKLKGLRGKIKRTSGLTDKNAQERALARERNNHIDIDSESEAYSNSMKDMADYEKPVTSPDSGGSFNSYQAQYLKNNEGSKSKIWHANNVGQKAKNYFTELEVLEKNGAEESAKIALARKYGFEPTAGGNFTEMGNAHFRKQLDADPSLWEKAMAHNVPAKATALGLTGGAVLAMANNRGQKSNAELYGV